MPMRRVVILLLCCCLLGISTGAAAPKTGGTYRFPLATDPPPLTLRKSLTPPRTRWHRKYLMGW